MTDRICYNRRWRNLQFVSFPFFSGCSRGVGVVGVRGGEESCRQAV